MSGLGKAPSVTGAVIGKEILGCLEAIQLDLHKFAGASCDGVSVMLGKHQAAMTLIKQHVPH